MWAAERKMKVINHNPLCKIYRSLGYLYDFKIALRGDSSTAQWQDICTGSTRPEFNKK